MLYVFRCFVAVAGVLGLLVAGCGGGDDQTAVDEQTSTTQAVEEATQVEEAFAVETGDCFDEVGNVSPSLPLDLNDIELVECGEPHDNEAFLSVEYTESTSFPGQNALDEAAAEACSDAFESYVGIAFVDSRYLAFYMIPNEQSWSENDRSIVCVLYLEGEKLTESAEGTAE